MITIIDNNIYKSVFDAFLYLVLYIIVPITQAIIYIITKDNCLGWCIFILLISIAYDCYTRFDGVSPIGKRKILTIGFVTMFMLVVTLVLALITTNGLPISDWAYFLYIPIVITVVINVWDLVGRTRMLISV